MTTITAETAAQLIREGFKVHSRKDWGSKTAWIYKTRRTTKPDCAGCWSASIWAILGDES